MVEDWAFHVTKVRSLPQDPQLYSNTTKHNSADEAGKRTCNLNMCRPKNIKSFFIYSMICILNKLYESSQTKVFCSQSGASACKIILKFPSITQNDFFVF